MTFAHFARRQLYKSEVRKNTKKSPRFLLSFWASITKPLVCPGASWDPAAKSNQRLAETFDHLNAQLNHWKHQSYCSAGKTSSFVQKKQVKSVGFFTFWHIYWQKVVAINQKNLAEMWISQTFRGEIGHLVFQKTISQKNIARGTTDPGYWLRILGYL